MKTIHLGALLEKLICGVAVPQPRCARGSGVIPMWFPAPHTLPPLLWHCLTCLQAELYRKPQNNAPNWWVWVSLCCFPHHSPSTWSGTLLREGTAAAPANRILSVLSLLCCAVL